MRKTKRIHITEEQFKRYVLHDDSNTLLELAKPNMSFRNFASDMKRMGFCYREGEGSSKVFKIPEYGDASSITIHTHNNGAEVPSEALREVKRTLSEIGWFNDAENRRKFPFESWGLSSNDIVYDKTAEEIESAKQTYQNALVTPVFPMKDSICVLTVDDKHHNLCRNTNDRRPLLDKWYAEFKYDNKTNRIPCLKIDNEAECRTEAYPILPNGTLDYDHMIIEGKTKRGTIL